MHYPIPLHRASGDCDQHQESVWVSLWVQDTRTNQSGKGARVHERAIVAHHTSTRCAHNQGSDATLYPSEAHECMVSVRKHVQSMIFVAPFKGSVCRSRARGCGAYSQLIETRRGWDCTGSTPTHNHAPTQTQTHSNTLHCVIFREAVSCLCISTVGDPSRRHLYADLQLSCVIRPKQGSKPEKKDTTTQTRTLINCKMSL